jgi:hypothetical protein
MNFLMIWFTKWGLSVHILKKKEEFDVCIFTDELRVM